MQDTKTYIRFFKINPPLPPDVASFFFFSTVQAATPWLHGIVHWRYTDQRWERKLAQEQEDAEQNSNIPHLEAGQAVEEKT